MTATDDKVLTDWNGLTIRGLATAGRIFSRPDLIAAAEQAADRFIRDVIGGRRPGDIGAHFEIDDHGLANLALPFPDADDRLDAQVVQKNNVHKVPVSRPPRAEPMDLFAGLVVH